MERKVETLIRSTVGSEGGAHATLVTYMEEGKSEVRLAVGVDVMLPTNKAEEINAKWERITALRGEFSKRLREVVGAS